MTGTLHVVATPIGNLEDITLRALRVLREVAVIAAEDTRRTAKLLAHHGIPTPTVSFHEHNTRSRVPQLIDRLKRGESVAVVSDAGTPGVSDPGLDLVQACVREGIPVDPVPGASAVLTALVASGFPTSPVVFLGFAPARSKDRTDFVSRISVIVSTVIFFEAPHRIEATLLAAAPYLGNRQLCVGRELTKVHQEFLRGTASELANCLSNARGELTVVVAPAEEAHQTPPELPDSDALTLEFRQLIENRALSRREAITELARKYDRPSREVYARLEAAKIGHS
jgi:16S rRNA (cytidine1402-2'-O)-methyltransferase